MSKLNDTSVEFNFPFSPYSIQTDFMTNLFQCLKDEKLGIFESPTGTGKSLSLICGALTWFIQHEKNRRIELQNQINQSNINQDDGGDDWFTAQCKQLAERDVTQQAERELRALKLKDERMQELRVRRKTIKRSEYDKIDVEFDELFKNVDEVRDAVKRELNKINGGNNLDEEEKDFAPGEYDYNSDDDDEADSEKKWNNETNEEEDYSLRIFYCSRTHSQLSQFVKEIQKTTYKNDIRLVSLASRANMCINEAVNKLGNVSLINEACRDLQKKKSSKKTKTDDDGKPLKKQKCSGGCQFFKRDTIKTLQDQALLEVQDIEQLVSKGRKLNACPYYASRAAISDAQVVVLPYNTLLHKETRDICGINLKNSIVIIDEAHNLLDTISQIHSAEVSLDILDYASQQVNQYFCRYKSRLLPKNLLYIKQVKFILTKMKKLLENTKTSKLMSTYEFINDADIFNLDMVKLVKYIEKSKLAQKVGFLTDYLNSDLGKENEKKKLNELTKKGVSGFLNEIKSQSSAKSYESKTTTLPKPNGETPENDNLKSKSVPTSSTTPIIQITALLKSLTSVQCEGRILISLLNDAIDENVHSKSIKYMLLNPSSQFSEIVSECRSIIVAGGTMHPLSEFRDQLFLQAGAKLDRVMNFSCDHVVPGENILPLVVKNGPSGKPLEFSFKTRDEIATIDELGRVICNICNMVPGGVVIFFPSYAYEKKVYAHFDKTGVLARILKKKQIFREPKKGSEMDKVLKDYARNACKQGAILLSVVGGKMSEGINFSDDLGRCVVMVGLPYPNIMSPELKERMDYLDCNAARSEDGRSAGQVHYENLCMKAVNQSIGRAIRHKGDYASIVLVDNRYSRANIIKQLPGWIKKHVIVEDKFGPIIPKLHKFYKQKNL